MTPLLGLMFSFSWVGYLCMSESYKHRGLYRTKLTINDTLLQFTFLKLQCSRGEGSRQKYQLGEYTEGFNPCVEGQTISS